MKIPKIINNNYVKEFALFACLSVPIIIAHKSCENQSINNAKSEIKSKDPQRFDKLKDRNMSVLQWDKEVKSMNDSLKLDSVSKKAYFEGMQAVRDSIKNAK